MTQAVPTTSPTWLAREVKSGDVRASDRLDAICCSKASSMSEVTPTEKEILDINNGGGSIKRHYIKSITIKYTICSYL